MPGLPPSLTRGSPVIVHVHNVVHSGDLLAALIGGGVVLIGVVLGEMLVRFRDRRRRLEDAVWTVLAIGTELPTASVRSGEEIRPYIVALGRVRTEARWPIRNAKEIRAELAAIMERLMVEVARSHSQGNAIVLLGLIGPNLSRLVFGEQDVLSRERINDALRAKGLPTLDDEDKK